MMWCCCAALKLIVLLIAYLAVSLFHGITRISCGLHSCSYHTMFALVHSGPSMVSSCSSQLLQLLSVCALEQLDMTIHLLHIGVYVMGFPARLAWFLVGWCLSCFPSTPGRRRVRRTRHTRVRRTRHTKHMQLTQLMFALIILSFLVLPVCGADSDSSSMPPKFKLSKADFSPWFMSFCGWVAMKYPDLVNLLEDDEDTVDLAYLTDQCESV